MKTITGAALLLLMACTPAPSAADDVDEFLADERRKSEARASERRFEAQRDSIQARIDALK